ncbi:MAG: ABC-F family ATP-binding cassette domain-containing protein [Hyphomicrobiaceae bacterium]
MPPPLLSLRNIHLSFGGTPLLEGADLEIFPADRLCLVGRNGSGKSTLLKIAAGLIEPDGGERTVQSGQGIRYLAQEPDLSAFATVLDFAASGLGDRETHKAREALMALGLDGSEATDRLSGGEAKRAALAQALAAEPDLLLLDEPTNHLDLPAIEWLETALQRHPAALVLISHDRRFLETLSRRTIWLDRGQTRALDRGFSAFEAWRDKLLEEEDAEAHKLDRRIAREVQWMHYGGVTARRRRNEGRRRALEAMRKERREARAGIGQVKLTTVEAEASGKLVVEAKEIAKSYGDRLIVAPFSIRIGRGDRVGIVGPNGAGKTTLLRMLTGALSPDTGTLRQGANVQMVALDQHRAALDPEATVAEVLTRGTGDTVKLGNRSVHVQSYLKDFLFQPEQIRSPTRVLSGGERGRLLLARALAEASNLLVLDEPTNDLDLETLDLLQEHIADYPGTVLVVSHDRDFLDRVATSIVAFEGEGRWVEYAGGYSDMVAQRGRGVEAPEAERAAKPKSTAEKRQAGQAKRKLSFKEKHALETLPGKITAAEAEIASLTAKLADPVIFRDAKAAKDIATSLSGARERLAAMEEEWLTLELLREELEGSTFGSV